MKTVANQQRLITDFPHTHVLHGDLQSKQEHPQMQLKVLAEYFLEHLASVLKFRRRAMNCAFAAAAQACVGAKNLQRVHLSCLARSQAEPPAV